MDAYCKAVRRLEEKFDGLELNHVSRKYNEAADALAKMASERATVPSDVFVSDLYKPSVDYKGDRGSDELPNEPSSDPRDSAALEQEAMDIEPEPPVSDDSPDWCYPLLQRLVDSTLPPDLAEARRVARRAKTFVLLDGEMYKRSASGVLMRCIPRQEGIKLLQDVHSGACGHHTAPRTLVGNAFRQGFYWPTPVADATEIVRTCEGCQFYARQIHLPAQALQTIPITWPFAVWGLDLFTERKFLQFCDRHHIRVDWAAVAHPKTNGQVERANGMILQGLKPRIFNRLNKFGKRWLKELPAMVWSLRTSRS
uniref:Putative GAG-POL n=1 Tax=Sorghum bicolor TaxID=4558 RepID=Q8W0U5_SORBI|nr:putative GAG-POL precursor [Sorghum bicolor]